MSSRSMISVYILCCFVVFYATNTEGKRFRTPCASSYLFRCDNGDCIHKHQWCNSRGCMSYNQRCNYDCNDRSDEKYCTSWPNSCDADIHFQCDSGMCIPVQGYCDGYSSCPDQSDERNCPCEELYESEGNVQYEAFIDQYRTQQKCWKISVNAAQYLQLEISGLFQNRGCVDGNVTVISQIPTLEGDISGEDFETNEILCPSDFTTHYKRPLIFYQDVLIRYRSNYYTSSSNSYKDFLNITFQKVDFICNRPGAFKCSKYSCILPEKQCDGNKDCANGSDEQNCDYGTLSAAYLGSSRIQAVRWLRSQHNADWAWNENTHRAVVALYLAGDANFNGTSKDDDLIAKQLELEVLTYLLRHKLDKVPSSELAAYINALQVICHDPRNFYGYNLISLLKEDLKADASFAPPFPYLTLCNAKESLPEDAVDHLLRILEISSPNHGFVLELQALATMVLSCINSDENLNQHLQQNITEALSNLKSQQNKDGSFGNEYTTALVLQALIANNQENTQDWNPKSSIQFLSQKQQADGSFGDFLTTYLIMPVLNGKSLLDVGDVNCTDDRKRPRDGNAITNIKNRFGKKIVMKYSLFIGDEKDQIHPLLLRAPENITVLDLMTLAADIDPKYKFKLQEMKGKKYIYEISNIPNHPENNKFWFIYESSKNRTLPIPEQSPDKIIPYEKDHIIMWYKSLDSL